MKTRPLYFDYNATTPVDPRVLDAMLPYFSETFGNPSSRQHQFGWDAEQAVETAREQVAALIGAQPKEIYFTSGATESNNLALKGLFRAYGDQRRRCISSPLEHKAVLEVLSALEKEGAQIQTLAVTAEGQISMEALEVELMTRTELARAELIPAELAHKDKALLLSVMWANNEIGTLVPLHEIATLAAEQDVIFHSDGAQAMGHHPLNVRETPVDLLSLSSHKIYGPKGAGALYIRKRSPRLRLAPLIHGGAHEMGMRAGTLNVPAVVGFGKACEIMQAEGLAEAQRLQGLCEQLWSDLKKAIPQVKLNGPPIGPLRLCNNLSVCFPVSSRLLLPVIAGQLAVSTGSACLNQESAGTLSHVLAGIGLSAEACGSTLRISVGRPTQEQDVVSLVEILARAVQQASNR